MRWRQVVVLYLVLAALAAEYWLVERRREPPAPGRPARQRFLALGPGALREIRLLRGGRTIVSRRAGDHWTVIEPAGAAIPPDLIAAFTDALVGAEEIEVVDGAGTDPRPYGLDEAAGRIEIVGDAGDPVVVTIGATNPTGTAVYARRAGAPAIVLIGRNVRYYEDLIFQALAASRAPAVDQDMPVGGS